ncbi:MAG: DNA methyltransferase [Candidatus Pacearchaeota archaeon]|jgi:DNA modification methylase
MIKPYYEEENITIYNGDCLKVMKELPDKSIDCVITDPPYKVSQKYGGGIDADNLTAVSSVLKIMPEISRVLKPNRFGVIFYDNRILPFLFESIKGTNLIYRKQIFLYRRWGNANRWCGWMQTTDPVCIFINGYNKPFMPKIKGRVLHDVFIKDKPEKFNAEHLAQKPLEMIKHIIGWCSDENEIILDCYLGSGTTARACKDLGRKCIGIEISKKYCDIAIRRLGQEVLNLND